MHLPTTYSSSNVILFTPSRSHGEAQPAAQLVELVQLVAHGLAPPRQVSRIVTSATRSQRGREVAGVTPSVCYRCNMVPLYNRADFLEGKW